jgi:hypothetical protein
MVLQTIEKQKTLYEIDYHLWLIETAHLLKTQRLEDLDVDHLLEEILDLGRRDKRKIESLLTRLLEHLLKLRYWEAERSRNQSHWRGEITNFRVQIGRELKVSPSLKRHVEFVLEDCYQDAIQIVAQRAELSLDVFPKKPIANLDLILNLDWFPKY